MHLAASRGHNWAIEPLIKHDPTMLTAKTTDNLTPLQVAGGNDKPEFVLALRKAEEAASKGQEAAASATQKPST